MAYIAPDYQPISAVSLFGNVPRFGHNDDLALLITGESDYKDYAIGISFIAATFIGAFLFWLVLLFLFKCCGRRVGFLSGQKLKGEKPHWLVRSVVMLAAAFGLAAGVMYMLKATTSLSNTFDGIRNTSRDLSDLALDITNIADDLILTGNQVKPIRDDLVQMIDQGVCSSFDGGNGDPIDVDEKAQAAVVVLTDLSDFTSGDLINIRENFSTEFQQIEASVNTYIDQGEKYAKVSYYAIGVITLSSFLYIGAYLAWFAPKMFTTNAYFCIQSWIILPILFLTLVVTTVIAAAIGTALVVNSDLCTSGEGNSPESLIKIVLDAQGVSGMERESIDHFIVTGCASDFSGTQALDNLVVTLYEGLALCSDLKEIISTDQSSFEAACGGASGSLDPVLEELDLMKTATASFAVIGNDAQELLECKGLNEIYLDLMHESICSNMPETLAWMFCTMTIILVSGMILITFRAALIPNDDSDRDFDDLIYDEGIKYMPSAETPPPHDNEANRNSRYISTADEEISVRSHRPMDDATADYSEHNSTSNGGTDS